MEKLKRISPRLPASLVRELKGECKRDGRIMEAAIAVAVREYLERRKQATA
jgi:metal-responsive CopG/Arc/MetJ family transcriptional regulator